MKGSVGTQASDGVVMAGYGERSHSVFISAFA
jgi:hypothetical protein